MRGEESCDIGEGSGGRNSRGRMLRVDNGGNTSSGRTKEVVEGERIVISMVESLCGGGGASDWENRRLVSARAVDDGVAEATEWLRPFFAPNCHLRTLPLELARRARDDTAFFTNPSRGLGPADLVGLGLDGGRGDGVEVEDGRDDDGDSSSSVSSALPSKPICLRSGDSCPRPVKMLRARLKGDTGGECTFVSSE